MTTKVVERLIEDEEGSDTDATAEEEDEEDVKKVGEASPKPKKTVTIAIGEEMYNPPIAYRSDNKKKQVLLKVLRSTTESSFQSFLSPEM
jgi:hypothetical protein